MIIFKKDWIAFWETLGDDWFVDESTFPECDDEELPEKFEGDAVILYQGSGDIMDSSTNLLTRSEKAFGGAEFSKVFKRYLKSLDYEVLSVEMPKTKVEALKTFLKSMGGKVV